MEAWRGESQSQNPHFQVPHSGLCFLFYRLGLPPPPGLPRPREGQRQAQGHTVNPLSFCSTRQPLPVILNVYGMTPPQDRSQVTGEMLPLELLKTFSIFQGNFKELWRFQLGTELMVAPVAVPVFIEGTISNSVSPPFSRVCSVPCSSDMPFYLISNTDLMRPEVLRFQ